MALLYKSYFNSPTQINRRDKMKKQIIITFIFMIMFSINLFSAGPGSWSQTSTDHFSLNIFCMPDLVPTVGTANLGDFFQGADVTTFVQNYLEFKYSGQQGTIFTVSSNTTNTIQGVTIHYQWYANAANTGGNYQPIGGGDADMRHLPFTLGQSQTGYPCDADAFFKVMVTRVVVSGDAPPCTRTFNVTLTASFNIP